MLGFLLRKKREDVRTIFSSHMNRGFLKQVCEEGRQSRRAAFCQVVWLVPYDEQRDAPVFDRAVPVLTKDICPEGLGLLHNRPVTANRIVLAVPAEISTQFFLCRIGHCTPLGYGFYQIGLHPLRVVDTSTADMHAFGRRQKQFESEEGSSEADDRAETEPAGR